MPSPVIHRLGSDPVVRFAASELARYLSVMSGSRVTVSPEKAYRPDGPGWWVGLAGAFGTAPAAEPKRDEVVLVDVEKGHGILSGSNSRSVLYAVYRYLEELGCRWFRPGPHGERVPSIRNPLFKTIALLEIPATRHRCICIEGSCSDRHVRDVIDYAAKRGFNAYFTQFRNSFTFYDRWHGLEKNRAPVRTPFSAPQALAFQEKAKRAALTRGLMLHTVGHGWTCEPFGLKGEEWASTAQSVPPDVRRLLALQKGKRALHGGIPLNTQLCFSRPDVRRRIEQAVADYAAAHPAEEVVHLWLADGSNNHCECAGCRAKRPADWYVAMLNGVDARLTKAGLNTRIVFLAYVDLLWAPERERLRHPDRFILMFAPITRSYSRSFQSVKETRPVRLPPYRRNKLEFPQSPGANLAMLAAWKTQFKGECVDFDYHLWRAHHQDPGQMRLARVLHEDASSLAAMGMDGFISCQCQRVAFPTGLYWETLGRALWNPALSFTRLAERYFADLFGAAGTRVRRVLESVSRLMADDLLDAPVRQDAVLLARPGMKPAIRRWKRVPAALKPLHPLLRKGLASRDPVTAAAWGILQHYAWYVEAYADFLARAWAGDPTASAAYSRIASELDRRLPAIHPVFDTWMCKGLMQHALWLNSLPFEERIVVKKQNSQKSPL
jgi:hypothetical protein